MQMSEPSPPPISINCPNHQQQGITAFAMWGQKRPHVPAICLLIGAGGSCSVVLGGRGERPPLLWPQCAGGHRCPVGAEPVVPLPGRRFLRGEPTLWGVGPAVFLHPDPPPSAILIPIELPEGMLDSEYIMWVTYDCIIHVSHFCM